MRYWLVLAFALLALPNAAAAKNPVPCTVEARPERTLVRLIYDPFENVQETQSFDLIVYVPDADAQACQLGVAIGGMGSGRERLLRQRGHTLRYEIDVNGLATANDLNAPAPFVPRKAGGSLTQPLKLVVAAGQFARAGSYTDQVTLRLYDLSNGVPRRLGTDMILAITVEIPPRAQINLAGSSSPIFGGVNGSGLDFGEMHTGKERDAFIQVRATAPVMLTLKSENRGELRHKAEPHLARGVPYSLTIDGESVNLRSDSARIDRTPSHGLGADNYRMVARILDAEGRTAGRYEDVITISVEPK